MKYVYLFILVLMCGASFAQMKSIRVINQSLNETIQIAQSEKVKIYTRYHKTIVGHLYIVNDSIIEVGQVPFRLSDIQDLYYRPKTHRGGSIALVVSGTVLLVGGAIKYVLTTASNAYFIVIGIINGSNYQQESYTGSIIAMSSGGAALLAGIIRLTIKKRYSATIYNFQVVIWIHKTTSTSINYENKSIFTPHFIVYFYA